MDGACIFKSFTEQGCLIPTPGAGDTDSPWEQGLGRSAVERGKGCPVGPLRRPQNGDWCPGKCSAKSSAWKGLGSNVKVTFAGDNQCLLWDVGRQWSRVRRLQRAAGMCAWGRLVSRQRQGDSWAGTAPVWLCWPRPGVQISRYLFAETPEGGKSRNTLPRYLRGCRES